ncbi:peptidase inhibitor family I36 protein [Myceligenerans xiligouense]|uniref:Peptidase inhibitor family I36 n=1 Tax=Myceligenerans xiligouense TaxID=253184 RepID=A0A3N4YTK9_9MICO|nr:peptidase inhibitor family I36 protein [Myceligenerans xiligouense]RPF22796.1 peptidase inhibitor family I36 [Myceligenerans xiligouense]
MEREISRAVARVVSVLAACVMMLGVGMVAAPTATAALSDCPSPGYGCSWKGTNYSGGVPARFQYNIYNYASLGSGWNNNMESVHSNGTNSSCRAQFFDSSGYSFDTGLYSLGQRVKLAPGQSYSSLSGRVLYRYYNDADGQWYNVEYWPNKISSARFTKASNDYAAC